MSDNPGCYESQFGITLAGSIPDPIMNLTCQTVKRQHFGVVKANRIGNVFPYNPCV
jgi:hypothetical protein